MKIYKIIKFFLFLTFFSACLISKKTKMANLTLYETPPGVIKIDENLFCDQTEISNLQYLEYLYWNLREFGSKSEEYLSSIIDSTVWLKADSCLHINSEFYLKHPSYKNYPVVGITQKQALDYCIWRSDRVFEMYLDKYKILPYRGNQPYFTIKKYFKGEFNNIKPDKRIKYYPEYSLPNIDERKQILRYSDSIDDKYFKKCNTKYCKKCSQTFPEMWTDIVPCLNGTIKIYPTRNVDTNCASKKKNAIYNLRGNVAEWLLEKNTTCGGGWNDKRVKILESDTCISNEKNCWTGFRNICKWKRVEDLK